MNLIGSHGALYNNEFVRERTSRSDLQGWNYSLQHFLSRLCCRAQVTKRKLLPILMVPASILPGRIVANAAHTHKQVNVAHYFGEDNRHDFGESQWFALIDSGKPYLICRKI